jgi:hypothetical protein
MSRERAKAATSPNVLELSMDAKAVIKVGEFSRYGSSRVLVFTLDHDHGFDGKVTPYGILLTAHKELTVSLATVPHPSCNWSPRCTPRASRSHVPRWRGSKVEAQVQRLPGLEAWFVDILCAPKAVQIGGGH